MNKSSQSHFSLNAGMIYNENGENEYDDTEHTPEKIESEGLNSFGKREDENDEAVEVDEEVNSEKFKIATGMVNDPISSTSESQNMPSDVQLQIEQQQQQIDMLIGMMKNQAGDDNKGKTSGVEAMGSPLIENQDASSHLLPPLPNMLDDTGEDEISDNSDSLPSSKLFTQSNQSNVMPLTPLKAMLFIDGTWLYYSIYERQENQCPLVKQFGKAWQYRYKINWGALPRIICEQISRQEGIMGWSSSALPQTANPNDSPLINTQRPIEVVRASVFTSYKKTTDPNSFRVRMYNEMAGANYDIHRLESVGNGPEKCVDISLAVEMLHYATVPNAYDVAILLSGDKDFMPALVRTRQKGRKVGIVSMRPGCNRSLCDSPHIKDYDVVWMDKPEVLNELLVPLPPQELDKVAESLNDRGLISAVTITKVILDFIDKSRSVRVSSRDVGRYLKSLQIRDGTNLLNDVKFGQGGLRKFLQQRPSIFEVNDLTPVEARNFADMSYWISMRNGAKDLLLEEAQKMKTVSTEEKKFLEDYKSGKVGGNNDDNTYYHTYGGTGNPETPKLDILPADLTEDYTTYTVARLKDRCRERSLPVSGTKAILLQRVEEDVAYQISHLSAQQSVMVQESKTSATTESTKKALPKIHVDSQVTIHMENLIKSFISQAGEGLVSSRALGRFLSMSDASKQRPGNEKMTALQELKNNFGTLSLFLEHKNDVFALTTIGDESDFSFGVKLKGTEHHQSVESYLESLVKEYIAISDGLTTSRNLGRYLASNRAWEEANQTALEQLKNKYGNLANYIATNNDVFSSSKDGNENGFGIRLNQR